MVQFSLRVHVALLSSPLLVSLCRIKRLCSVCDAYCTHKMCSNLNNFNSTPVTQSETHQRPHFLRPPSTPRRFAIPRRTSWQIPNFELIFSDPAPRQFRVFEFRRSPVFLSSVVSLRWPIIRKAVFDVFDVFEFTMNFSWRSAARKTDRRRHTTSIVIGALLLYLRSHLSVAAGETFDWLLFDTPYSVWKSDRSDTIRIYTCCSTQ